MKNLSTQISVYCDLLKYLKSLRRLKFFCTIYKKKSKCLTVCFVSVIRKRETQTEDQIVY